MTDTIKDNLDKNIYARAGAGTGKTTKLIQRLNNLLSTNVDPKKIVIITFTHSAADEINNRIRNEITNYENLSDIFIGTIHEFSLKIINQGKYLDKSLAKSIRTLSENESLDVSKKFFESWSYNKFQNDKDFTNLVFFLQFFFSKSIEKFIFDIFSLFNSKFLHLGEISFNQFNKKKENLIDNINLFYNDRYENLYFYYNEIINFLKESEQNISSRDKLLDDKLYIYLRDEFSFFITELKKNYGSNSASEIYDFFSKNNKLKTNIGKKDNWKTKNASYDSNLSFIKDNLKKLNFHFQELRNEIIDDLLIKFSKYLFQYVKDFYKFRKSQGTINFDDQIFIAKEILSDGNNLDFFIGKYDYIFIDEFQDTDPFQMQITTNLIKDGEDNIQSGSLFIVGDEKQSIYSFRRADINKLQKYLEKINIDNESLKINYRSDKNIINFVNDLFGKLFENTNIQYEQMISNKDYSQEFSSVFYDEEITEEKSITLLRENTAEKISSLVKFIHDGNMRLPSLGRIANIGDICVLVNRNKDSELLSEIFKQKKIPYLISGDNYLIESNIFHLLKMNFKAIYDSNDEISILSALKSFAWGCSDDDIYNWRLKNNTLNYKLLDFSNIDISKNNKNVFESLIKLNELNQLIDKLPLSIIFDKFEIATDLVNKISLSDDYENELAYLEYIKMQVFMDFDSGKILPIKSLIKFFENDKLIKLKNIHDSNLNKINIMTIHESKGREFPIVLMFGIPSKSRGNSYDSLNADNLIVEEGDFTYRLSPNLQMKHYEQMYQKEQENKYSENIRKLYVALTRSEDFLFIFNFFKQTKSSIYDLPYEVSKIIKNIDFKNSFLELFKSTNIINSKITKSNNNIEFSIHDRDYINTQLDYIVSKSQDYGYKNPSDDYVYSKNSIIGKAVHEIMKNIDFNDMKKLENIAEIYCDRNDIVSEKSKVVFLCKNLLNSKLIKSIKNKKYYKEIWVSNRIDDYDLEGFIDLLIENNDKSYSIIDYKTTSEKNFKNLSKVSESYKSQILDYVKILKSQKKIVKDAKLLFVSEYMEDAFEYNIDIENK